MNEHMTEKEKKLLSDAFKIFKAYNKKGGSLAEAHMVLAQLVVDVAENHMLQYEDDLETKANNVKHTVLMVADKLKEARVYE